MTLRNVNVTVKARFVYGVVKYQSQGVLCTNMKEIHEGTKKLCPML